MVPYLASLGWYSARLEGRVVIPPKGRWNRTLLAPDEMLTIPVNGGISAVKRDNPELWTADDSRPWRHQHLGAINARCSRTPYYRHYSEPILDVIADRSAASVAEICGRIDSTITDVLHMEQFADTLRTADAATICRLADYSRHICPDPNPDIALATYLFLYGPDTIFLVARALIDKQCQLV